MKQLLVIVFSLSIFNSFAQLYNPHMDFDSFVKAHEANVIGKPFPEFTATYNLQNFDSKKLEGKTIFVNFWFETCHPCMTEMNALNELYDSLKHKPNFEFISFTWERQEIIDEVIKKYNIQYKIVSISQAECKRLNQESGYPTSIIIDSKGIIKFMKNGGSINEAEARKYVFKEYYPKILNEL